MAWQRALTQIDAFVGAKDGRNPAAQYLQRINAQHRRQWPRHIMTHVDRDRRLSAPADKLAAWREYGQRQIDSALGTISLIMARHRIQEQQQVAARENVAPREIERVHVKHVYVEQAHAVPSRPAQKPAHARPASRVMSITRPAATRQVAANSVAVQSWARSMARPAQIVIARSAARPVVQRVIAVQQSVAHAIAKQPQIAKTVVRPARPAVMQPVAARPARPALTSSPRMELPQRDAVRMAPTQNNAPSKSIAFAGAQTGAKVRNMMVMFRRMRGRAA